MVSALPKVGGQAVLEGVMMRAGDAMVTAVRHPNGTILVRDDGWVPLDTRFPWLKRPFLRGTVVLVESMINGMQSLSFSARVAEQAESDNEAQLDTREGGLAIAASLSFSLVLAIGLFIYLPHWFAGVLLNGITGKGLLASADTAHPAFHILAGGIKLSLFLGYLLAIRRLPDIRRVFQYHGAEHKSIHAFEAGELTVDRARQASRLHPRCGTSFLVFVIATSIFVFAAVFPFIQLPTSWPAWQTILVQASIKVPLMFPVAGLSYEFIRLAGAHQDHPLLARLARPGLWMQHLTTAEPDDQQLEVALVSLRRALEREGHLQDQEYPSCSFLQATGTQA